MKYLVFADLHAHSHKKYSTTTEDGINSRLELALRVLRDLRYHAEHHGIKKVLFAGDLFEAYNKVPMQTISLVHQELCEWSACGVEMLMIPGNHDHAVKTGEFHGLQCLSSIPGLTIINEPQFLLWGGLQVLALPYRREQDASWFSELPQWDGSAPRLILGHGSIEGVCGIPTTFPPSSVAPHGEWYRRAWIEATDATHVIVGHIHNPTSTLWSRMDHTQAILVPGCPYQDDLHGIGQQRGFWVLNTAKPLKKCFTQVPNAYPRFVDIEITEHWMQKYGMKEPPWSAKREEGGVSIEVGNNIVRLVLREPTVDALQIQTWKEDLYAHGAAYVDIVPDPKVFASRESDEPRVAIDIQADCCAIWQQVMACAEFDLRGESPEELTTMGLELLNEAIQGKGA